MRSDVFQLSALHEATPNTAAAHLGAQSRLSTAATRAEAETVLGVDVVAGIVARHSAFKQLLLSGWTSISTDPVPEIPDLFPVVPVA